LNIGFYSYAIFIPRRRTFVILLVHVIGFDDLKYDEAYEIKVSHLHPLLTLSNYYNFCRVNFTASQNACHSLGVFTSTGVTGCKGIRVTFLHLNTLAGPTGLWPDSLLRACKILNDHKFSDAW